MNQQSLERIFNQLFEATDLCVANKLRTPALILIYSTIDIAGWLHSDKRAVVDRFTEWVDTYLLPGSSLKCASLDLYGARCGVVHTYSPVSHLSNAGKVRPIGYAWHPSTASDLEKLVAAKLELDRLAGVRSDSKDYFIAVQVEGLIEALRKGVKLFLRELDSDQARAESAYVKVANVFEDLSADSATDMLRQAEAIIFPKEVE